MRQQVDIECTPKHVKIKDVLTACVRGDLTEMQNFLEGDFVSSDRPGVNCADARGKSLLMYAAGL